MVEMALPFSLNHKFSCALALICLLNHLSHAEVSDQEFLDNYNVVINKIACEAMGQTQGSEMKVNLSRYSTREELAKLAFWNYGNDLKDTKLEFGEDIAWKRTLVDTLFKIFTNACPDTAVPHKYMNIFREFAMIYINSVEPRDSNHTLTWQNLQEILNSCEGKTEPYKLTFKALKVHGILGKKGDMFEVVELYPPEDKVDVIFNSVDWIIDNLWWVFSHAMGTCFNLLPRTAIMAPKFKALFIKEILKPMLNRWADPGPLQDFGPIVGNFDILRAQRNIRFCVTAAYLTKGITEIQMVRPLRVGFPEDGKNRIVNKKTGAAIG